MYQQFRILVADDSEDDVVLLKRAFLRAGIDAAIEFVSDGQDAVDYLGGRAPFDDRQRFPLPKLMMLDVKMPGVDGFDVLEWLRRQPGLRGLPVIMWSSSEQQEDVNRAYALGANSYLAKPTQTDRFEEMVKAIELYWMKTSALPEVTALARA